MVLVQKSHKASLRSSKPLMFQSNGNTIKFILKVKPQMVIWFHNNQWTPSEDTDSDWRAPLKPQLEKDSDRLTSHWERNSNFTPMSDHADQSKESTPHIKMSTSSLSEKTPKESTAVWNTKSSQVSLKTLKLFQEQPVKTLLTTLSNTPSKMVILFLISGRHNVIACHKAGIMKMGDGLFIKVASEVSKKYPEITYRE